MNTRQLHNFLAERAERRRVVEIAKSWLGTPHVHNARVKGAGVDCGQFVAAVFEEAGLVSPVDLGTYPPDWYLHRDDSRYLATVELFCTKRKWETDAEPGDVVLYNFGRCIGHGGIVVEWPLIVHAYVPNKQVTLDDTIANEALKERLVGAWCLKRWR